jgi:hypothetical protein
MKLRRSMVAVAIVAALPGPLPQFKSDVSTAGAPRALQRDADRPDVMIVLTDQQRADAFGAAERRRHTSRRTRPISRGAQQPRVGPGERVRSNRLAELVIPWRDIYWPVRRDARLVMQMDVATRACVKRIPSDAILSSRAVRTTPLPAAPIESHRVSSMTSTTMFIGRAAVGGAGQAGADKIAVATTSANAVNRMRPGERLSADPVTSCRQGRLSDKAELTPFSSV